MRLDDVGRRPLDGAAHRRLRRLPGLASRSGPHLESSRRRRVFRALTASSTATVSLTRWLKEGRAVVVVRPDGFVYAAANDR